jgi:predicted TIM-barrel fold metal-dependent hydrolase
MNPSPIAGEYLEQGYSETCPLIDMHCHLGPFLGSYLPNAEAEAMVRTKQRYGVKRLVAVPHAALLADPARGNRYMQATIDAYPRDFLGYWGINPHYQAIIEEDLRSYDQTRGFVGLKFLPDYHAYPVDGPLYQTALRFADERGLLVLIHTWGLSLFNSPRQVGILAERYPNAILVMGHSGYGEWDTSLALARDYPNVYLELTAVYVAHDFSAQPAGSGTPLPLIDCLSVNGIIERMVEVASSRKILFGTDLPWYGPMYAAGAVLFARISDEARHDILHRNAERLLAEHLNYPDAPMSPGP